MREIKQSAAANIAVFMADSSDHITGKTGLTLTITASKDGGAFASISPTVTELADGWYNLALTTTHTNTLGDLAIHITGSGADPTDFVSRVIAIDKADSVRMGMTSLPNAAAEAFGGLITRGTSAGQISVSSGHVVLLDGSLVTSKLGDFVLAKTTHITGFNDIAATDVVSNGAITTSSGAVSSVTTTTNLTNDPAGVTTLLNRIPAALFSGITSLAQWLGLIAGKQTGNSTARTELRATGAGSGTFDETTDSTEAIRDRGDAAWITATGFSTLTSGDLTSALNTYGALKPTTPGRTLDVTAAGNAGIDWGNVENQSTTVNLQGTDIAAVDVDSFAGDSNAVLNLISMTTDYDDDGKLSAHVVSIANDAITSASMAASAGGEIATAVLTAAQSAPIYADVRKWRDETPLILSAGKVQVTGDLTISNDQVTEIIEGIVDGLQDATLTYTGPITPSGDAEIYQGGSYIDGELEWEGTWTGPDIDGAEATAYIVDIDTYKIKGLAAESVLDVEATIALDGTDLTVTIPELTSAQSAQLFGSPDDEVTHKIIVFADIVASSGSEQVVALRCDLTVHRTAE